MKKLASILLAVSSLSLTAHADFYAGLKIGPSFNTGQFSYSGNRESVDLKGTSAATLGGLFLGYDMVTSSNFYMAGEVNLLLHSLKNTFLSSQRDTIDQFQLKNNFLYGMDLQFGYKLSNDVIPFFSLGFVGGEFKLSNANGAKLASTKKINFNPGMGIRYVYDQFMVTTQYQYLMGSKLSWQEDPSDARSPNLTQKIKQHYFSLGFAYAM